MLKFDLNVCYDEDLSVIWFNEFIEFNDLLRVDDKLVIFNNNTKEKPFYKKSHLLKMTKDDLKGLCRQLDLIDWSARYDDYLKADFVDLLLSVDNGYYYAIAIEKNFICECDFVVRGYSQRDFTKVWQVGGSEYSEEYLSDLFYKTPIEATLRIYEITQEKFLHDSEELEIETFYLDGLLNDNYNYDREEIISKFKLESTPDLKDLENKYQIDLEQEIKKYLSDNLPDSPTY